MKPEPVHIDAENATQIVRDHLDERLTVVAVRRRYTRPVNVIYEWHTDGQPEVLIAKICGKPNDLGLHQEMAALEWYRDNTEVPVPNAIACVTDFSATFDGWEPTDSPDNGRDGNVATDSLSMTCLLMERLPGRNLSEARLSPAGHRLLQHQLARCAIDLHSHRREKYGNALSTLSFDRWLDRFQPSMRSHFSKVQDRLSKRSRWVINEMIDDLERWLPEFNEPALIHGDLWSNNILVDDHDPHRPKLMGLIDGGVNYSDVEYELAYLRAFHTVDRSFFDYYSRHLPLRPGFGERYFIYLLHTAMRHVTTFGPEYLETCEQIATRFVKQV